MVSLNPRNYSQYGIYIGYYKILEEHARKYIHLSSRFRPNPDRPQTRPELNIVRIDRNRNGHESLVVLGLVGMIRWIYFTSLC